MSSKANAHGACWFRQTAGSAPFGADPHLTSPLPARQDGEDCPPAPPVPDRSFLPMLQFDHAVINVLGEMDTVLARYERLGFQMTPRGYHTLGSINHLAVFPECYIELLGYAPGEKEKRAEQWVYPAGLTGLAVRPEDAAATHSALEAAGIPLEPYREFSRPVEVDGETRDASFRTFQIDRNSTANGRLFYCQHLTPEFLWRKEHMTHPNGATGIAGATIACVDPDAIHALMAETPEIAKTGPRDLKAGNTVLRFRHPDELANELGGAELPALLGKSMRMVCLDIACRSLDDAANLLIKNGVPFDRDGGTLRLAPKEAGGVILRFT
ncbi:VOC family protein [Rhodobacterales bacterium]|nr:VOC family protein [Rhodobacterales bacterium]